jgi:hypothetical protein
VCVCVCMYICVYIYMQIFVSLTLLVMCTEIDFSPMGLFLYPALIGLITYVYLIIIH